MENDSKYENLNDNLEMTVMADDPVRVPTSTPSDYTWTLCLVGSAGVGKTSLLTKLIDNRFTNQHSATVGVDFKVVSFKYQGKVTKFHIWDVSGDKNFIGISKNSIAQSKGAVLVFDLNDRKSFESLEEWIGIVEKKQQEASFTLLIGNKCDLDRVVTYEEATGLAEAQKMFYIETSAKMNTNVEEAFRKIVVAVADKRKKDEFTKLKEENSIHKVNTYLKIAENLEGESGRGTKCCTKCVLF